MKRDALGKNLEELAKAIATDALEAETKPSDRLEAMKVLTAYYVGTRKIKSRQPDDPEDGVSFDKIRENIRLVDGGKS